MSVDTVRAWLEQHAPDLSIVESEASTATVQEAARTLGIEPGRIAKTLAVRAAGQLFVLVTRGDARLDNGKAKAAFGGRPRMLNAEESLAVTGHPVGGVCPFALANPLPIYLDVSLLAFEDVFPAAGSGTSSVKITPQRLAGVTHGRWVDICSLALVEG